MWMCPSHSVSPQRSGGIHLGCSHGVCADGQVLRAQKALDAKNKSARHPRRKTVPTSQQPPPPPASRAVARVSSSASADTDGDDGSDDDDEEDV
eukprot:m.47455 g.47455  ORF g.47455 m.47455 type:complete len:94 (-) comp15225_c0_seq1:93-374(-)